jgi:sortase B
LLDTQKFLCYIIVNENNAYHPFLLGGTQVKGRLGPIGSFIRNASKIRLFFIAGFVLCFLSCLVYLIGYRANAESNKREMKQLSPAMSSVSSRIASSTQSVGETEESASKKVSILPQFQKLYNQNSDIFGWLCIDGTNINYPVMFTPHDSEYYLHRNFQRQPENRGLPFLDGGTDTEKSSNYLIYGHSMKDGTEFADLLHYQSKSYFQEHPIIHFNTIYQTGDYQIIGVLLSKVYNQHENTFKYYKFNYPASKEQYMDYVANVKKLSLYNTGVTVLPGEPLLTLSTCSYQTKDGRLAVVAKRIIR